MCWSAIASPGMSPCVAADAAPSATAPTAAPIAAAIPMDTRSVTSSGWGEARRLKRLWYDGRKPRIPCASPGRGLREYARGGPFAALLRDGPDGEADPGPGHTST